MSELKATPGPWEASKKTATLLKNGEVIRTIEVSSSRYYWLAQVAVDTGMNDGEGRANANLIAAAPDLYAELKAAEKILEGVLVDPWRGVMPFEPEASKMRADLEQMGRIRAALAKARGEVTQ